MSAGLRLSLAALLLGLMLKDGAAAPSFLAPASLPDPAAGFVGQALPLHDAGDSLLALRREALDGPARYRVVVLPGSGCSGLRALADRMFAGLRSAHVLLLHKPGVQPDAGAAPLRCPPGFVERDDLGQWLRDAGAALRAHEALAPPRLRELPLLLLGISEGAELLPFLADALPQSRALIMLGGSGLDPVDAGALQAEALGEGPAWQALAQAQASARPDEEIVDGRTLRYWRSLWRWRSAQALLQSPLPLVQVWGERDAAVPAAAYLRFAERARLAKGEAFCSRQLAGADHGLQRPGFDGLQRLWAGLERWAADGVGLCPALRASLP